jgi:hypothetical protein
MLQRFLTGEFHVEALGVQTWVFANRRQPGQMLLLRRVQAAPPLAAERTVEAFTVTWTDDRLVTVACSSEGRTWTVTAQAALLHEPVRQIYEQLPLPAFTPPMRRFWRRVFRLVRIPGGRWVIGWLARRSRRPA